MSLGPMEWKKRWSRENPAIKESICVPSSSPGEFLTMAEDFKEGGKTDDATEATHLSRILPAEESGQHVIDT
ncbi:hypothetical protein ZHAS_00006057 [Anopheles sinensis]|uniref:Uncharacterized protein n=1 Tax=Anopheles sinensis TaxID=74873 RepID=A0A084VL03_ANOSI|nr:hypothetical protein ZHAS_00006057 [Anopheles sinensis]